jgi:phage terminase small subunit
MTVKQLTQKQYNFVNHYITNGFNAAKAACDAGYSEKYSYAQAYSLVNHPAISEHLKNAYQSAEKETEVTFAWKINKLKQIITAFENSPLSQDAKVVIAAIAELNRMTGDYEPSKRVSLTIDTTKERLSEVKRAYAEY